MLKCRDVGQLLQDYVEGTLETPVRKRLEEHLADCPGCLAFIETYKHTIAISKDLRCKDIPPELRRKLRGFIKERLGRPSP